MGLIQDIDLEVEVVPIRVPGRSYLSDLLSCPDRSYCCDDLIEMGVIREDGFPVGELVLDDDRIPPPRKPFRRNHLTVSDASDRGSFACGDIDS